MESTSHLRVLLLCIGVRLLNALCTGASVFNPDEYWQSMEVAYKHVWSGGFIPWEYQSHAQLRGFLHPLIFTLLYAALKRLGIDTRWTVAHGPRLLQAIFAGVGDYFLYMLAYRLLGRRGAIWTVSSETMRSLSKSRWFLTNQVFASYSAFLFLHQLVPLLLLDTYSQQFA